MAPDDTDPSAERTLLAVRREIDSIDDTIHDLLMKRTHVVAERVVTAKGRDGAREGGLFRGGREAAILRRLVARHRGPLPVETIARVWREIISALTRLQGPFAVAAYASEGAPAYVDLAREHFGGPAPLQPVTSVASALAALDRGRAQLAVLPLPEDSDDPWWRGLGGGRGSRRPGSPVHILARLPFLTPAARSARPEALVVGRQAFDPSGDDRGYLLVETEAELSRARIRAALEAAGLAPIGFPAAAEEKSGRSRAGQLQLVETATWIPGDDARLKRVAAALGDGTGLRSLGGYARPIAVPASKRK